MTHREFYQLCERIKDLEELTQKLKAERDAKADEIMEKWMETGDTMARCDGRTIYLHTRTYALMPRGKEAAIELLQASDDANIVQPNINANTLAALIREKEEDGQLPPEWDGIIEAGHKYSIRVRKS